MVMPRLISPVETTLSSFLTHLLQQPAQRLLPGIRQHQVLLQAPQQDPDGRPAVIRFSRKTKEQYVQSEVDGKPTGWKAFYDGGKWKVEDKRQGA